MRLSIIIIITIILCMCIVSSGCITQSSSNQDETIVIWAYDSVAKVAQEAVDIYLTEHPDCEYDFTVVTLGQEDMVEKIKVYLATDSIDSLPNLFYDEDYNFLEYITYYNGYFVDLTQYINNNDYYDFKLINVNYNDKIYALPYDCGSGVLFYRLDIINAAGYTEEDMKNLTWDKYIEIGKTVKSTTGIDMLTIIPEGDMEGRLLYQSAGTWFFDTNGNANILNNKGFVSALTTLKNAFDAGIVYKASSWDDMVSCIANTKIASFVGGSWWAPIIASYDEQSGKWRVAEMPKMENGCSYSNLGGGNWFVMNKSGNDKATEFAIEMFGNNQYIADYAANTYYLIPVNKKLIQNLGSSENSFFGDENVVSFMSETVPYIPPVKYGLHTYEVTYVAGGYVGEYINGELTLDQAIEKMHSVALKVVASK